MKWKSVIVLLATGISIAVPPSFSVSGVHGNHATIGNLDVCHQAASVQSANGSSLVCTNASAIISYLSRIQSLIF